MTTNHEESVTPDEVSNTASMAIELHKKLFPQAEEQQQAAPEEGALPAEETKPVEEEQQQQEQQTADDEDYREKYLHLQGKFNKEVPRLHADIRELKQNLERLQNAQAAQPGETKASTDDRNALIEQEIARLREEFPEELVDGILRIQKLQAEELVSKSVQPVQQQAQTVEDVQYQISQQNYINYVSAKAPGYEKIWTVACELADGDEPSDLRVAEFLQSPDPSGLYTNLQLIHMYNDEWEADRFATLCNMFQGTKQTAQKQSSPQRAAMVAPSRSASQPMPSDTEKRIWTMAEFNKFQVDARNGVYSDEEKAEIWKDVQTALAENRIRG